MFEVEAKIPITDQESLLDKLRDAGAKDKGRHLQEDTYFSHPNRDFARTDEALRLRHEYGRMELTYKGPKGDGVIKSRQEENVVVKGDVTALLRGIGFAPGAQVIKTRWSWLLGGAVVAIDDVAGLGLFVEVEATGDDVAAAQKLVAEVCQTLGLSLDESLTKSYLELLQTAD